MAPQLISAGRFVKPYPLTAELRAGRLALPAPGIRMVMDTDTYNEIDDQFALAYSLLSPDTVSVEAVYAAPFHNSRSAGPLDGMIRSYEEILRVLSHLPLRPPVLKGSGRWLTGQDSPVASDAVDDLLARCDASGPDNPLYVVAIGAPTNIASAILTRPEIVERIVVLWLGGHPLHWPTAREFNLRQDIAASRVLLDSGVPLILVPCHQVAELLLTTLAEVEQWLRGKSALGDYLCDIFAQFLPDHFAASRSIWDVAAVAPLIDHSFIQSTVVPSPIVADDFTWHFEPSRHPVRVVTYVKRDNIFADLFRKIASSRAEG